MSKSDEKLTLLRDIRVYEHVAGDQASTAHEQFEATLDTNPELQSEVDLERQLRSAISQTKPTSPVEANNIDALFDRINAQDKMSVSDTAQSNVIQFAPRKTAIGFGIAASLFLAVFLSVNFAPQSLLAPEFQTLTSKDPVAANDIDLNALINQKKVVTLEFSASASVDDITSLINKHQLQQLNQQHLNGNIVTAFSDKPFDNKALSKLKSEQLIEASELFKF